jgi:hypothetical protein
LFSQTSGGVATDGRWAVRFPLSSAPMLVPPPRSLSDGAQGIPVTVRCLGAPTVKIPLTLDAGAAERIARIAGWYRRVRRYIAPPALVSIFCIAVFAYALTSGLVTDDQGAEITMTALSALILLALYVPAMIAVIVFKKRVEQLKREIPQYPARSSDRQVIMRDLEPGAVQQWMAVNEGVIERVG